MTSIMAFAQTSLQGKVGSDLWIDAPKSNNSTWPDLYSVAWDKYSGDDCVTLVGAYTTPVNVKIFSKGKVRIRCICEYYNKNKSSLGKTRQTSYFDITCIDPNPTPDPDPDPDPDPEESWSTIKTSEGYSMWYLSTTLYNEKCCVIAVPSFKPSSAACIDQSITGKVTIPSADISGKPVRRIDNCAFYNIKGLTELVIPSSVKYVQTNIVTACSSLKSITCENLTPPTLQGSSICDNASDVTLYVPKDALSNYQTAKGWRDFKSIRAIGDIVPEPISIILPNYIETVYEGKTITLKPTITPSNAETTLAWTTSDRTIATINQNGVVTGIKEGEAKITVTTSNGKSAYCYVQVKKETIEPTGISVSPSSKTIKVGETFTVDYSLTPSNATTTVTWSSDNSSIASVNSSTGTVTGVSAGYTYINAKTTNGKTNWCKVTVESPVIKITSITLSTNSVTMDVSETKQLYETVYPSNATNKSVTWSSSNTSVATVSTSGYVFAKSAGTTTITCKANDGSGVSATCSVSVKEKPVLVTKITLNASSSSLSVGDIQQLTATITPSNATNKNVTWSSSNTSVATVSTSGYVSAKSAGTTTITCKANDGSGVSATCSVTVKEDPIPVTKITLNASSATLNVGDTKQLTTTITPSNATNKTVTWSSSKTSVATVSSTGLVTAKTAGSATITCKANDGSGVYATCSVTVNEPTPNINFISVTCSNTNLTNLAQDDKLKFSATFKNTGKTANIKTILGILNKDTKKIMYRSVQDSREFAKDKQVTIDYEYSLTNVPAGEYLATVLYYRDWGDSDDQGWYYYTLKSITVKSATIPVTKITLNASSATLNVGDTKQLTATITPSNATNKTVTWSSSNASVATVSSSGLVTAKAEGSATIACKANDGSEVQSSCKIVVSSTPTTPEIEFVSITCVNDDLKNLNQSDKLKVRAVIKNTGTTARIKTRLDISDRKYTRSLFASNVDEREFIRDELVTIDYELPLQDVPAGDYGAVVEYYYDWGSFSNYWMCGGFDKWAVYITIKGIDYTDISKYTNIIYSEASTVSPDSETDFIVKMKNATNNSIMGFQFDLALPTGVTVPKDEDGIYQIELSGDRTNSRKHTVASSLQSNGAIRVVCYSNNNNTFSGQDGTVLAVRLKAGKGVAVGEYPIYLRDVVMTTPTMNNYNVSEVVSKLIVEDYKKGDVNGDKTVNVVDVAGVVNLILGNNITGLNKKAADINGDNIVNVVDVAGVVNIILGQPANSRTLLLAPSANKTSLYIDDIDLVPGETKEVKVNLNNPGDAFTGCQFDLYLPKGISIVEEDGYALVDIGSRSNSRKHTVSTSVQPDGAVRVVCYSNNNNTFSGEQGDILTVTLHVANNAVAGNYNLRIGNITLSRTDVTGLTLDDYSARVSIIPTGINNAWAESISNSPVYTVSGQRLKKPRKGINIIDGRKVIVK